jgi:hypothetical protein
MKSFKYILFSGLVVFFLISCDKNEKGCSDVSDELVIFGHFYGKCVGEGCVEIFKLEEDGLYEDKNDIYPNGQTAYEGSYIQLSKEKFELVKDLGSFFPDQLFDEAETVIGMPDFGDWGGIYIEIDRPGKGRRFWLLDQSDNNMPAIYNEFVDVINEKIQLINQ